MLRPRGLLLLPLLVLGGCGPDDVPPDAGAPEAPAGFSLDRPGDRSPEEARKLAPDLSLVRTAQGFRGHVRLDPAAAPRATLLQVLGAEDRVLATGKAVADLPFDLPPGYAGPLTAKVVYEDGEVWRFDTDL